MSFSVINQNFSVYAFAKKTILTTWPQERAPEKHYKNRGFSKPISENHSHGTAIFGQKSKPKTPIIIFGAFFFSVNNKKHKNPLNPPILLCFSKLIIISFLYKRKQNKDI